MCVLCVATTCNDAILQHFVGSIPTSTPYRCRESQKQSKGTPHLNQHQKKKNGQTDPDAVFSGIYPGTCLN